MVNFTRFEELDDEARFVELVCNHFKSAWAEVTDQVGLTPVVDQERAKLAFGAYTQSLRPKT